MTYALPGVWLVIAAACHASGPPPRPSPAPSASGPVEQSEVVAELAPVAAVGAVAAPPRASIIQLAVTPDGGAALSADARGELRLWPTLDGSREPMVVDAIPIALAPPTAIALARGGDGFTAFLIDREHRLVIARLGADGVTAARAVVGAAIEAFAMAEPGLVAVRGDRTVAVYAADGRQARRIAAMPGERVTAITAAGGHAAAVVERDGRTGIRVLELAPRLAWGAYVEDQPDHGRFAISPRGDRLAVVTVTSDWKTHLVVADLQGRRLLDATDLRAEVVGFVDDDTLVCWDDSALYRLDLRDRKPRKIPLYGPPAKPLLVFGGGRALSRSRRDLAIAGATSATFLGYAMASPRAVDQLATGELVVASTTHLFTTDLSLELRRELEQDHHVVTDLRWLAGDDVAAVVSESSGSRGDSKLYLMNVARGTWTVLRSELSASPSLAVEPATGMLAVNDRESELLRYRADSHTVVSVAKAPRRAGEVIQPLDPKLAGARVAHVQLPKVSWFATDTVRGAPIATQRVAGELAAIDAAGKVYVSNPDLTIVAPGVRARRIPARGGIWPDPRGERFAMTAEQLALFNSDGTELWSRDLGPVERAIWLRDGTLAVFDDSGIARLDPADGRVIARRCGWQFGAAAVPHEAWIELDPIQDDDFDPQASRSPSLCARSRP